MNHYPLGASLVLPGSLNDQVKAHALAEYPKECCGVVVDNTYIPLTNVHEEPEKHFRLPRSTWLDYKGIQAVIHSHTKDQYIPSKNDMAGQVTTKVPWGLVTTNGETCTDLFFWGGDPPPLLGRTFRYGPSGTDNGGDCYAIIKDWYLLELGVKLREYPRDPDWWYEDGNMYLDNFRTEGFTEVDKSEVTYGDILLFKWIGNKPHHASIYLGNNMMLHHLSDRLSRRDLVSRWLKLCTHVLRYNKPI